jgi:hypothetical protein
MGDRDMNDEHVPGGLPAVVHSGMEKALGIQHSTVADYVRWLRRRRPAATPAGIISALEKQYLVAITSVGAVVGGAAALPGIGSGLAFTLSAGETAFFLETTALFTLAVAEVHTIRVKEVERRRTLVLTVALGDGGTMLVEKMAGRTGEHWGKLVTDLIPMSSISAVNKTLGHWFMTQYPDRYGIRLVGKIVPFGIGAGIGAVGNFGFGRMVVNASRRVFGPPPTGFIDSGTVTIVDPARSGIMPAGTPAPDAEPGPESAAPAEFAALGRPVTREPAQSPVTGKYRPLFDHLAAHGADRVELGFSDIDAVVTGGLPKSAFTTRSWWSNSASSRQAKAWLTAGFAVTEANLVARKVRFARRAQRA